MSIINGFCTVEYRANVPQVQFIYKKMILKMLGKEDIK